MRGLGFFVLSVSINKSGAEKFLENELRVFLVLGEVNFFDGFKVEHRNLALSHSIETL